MEQTLQGVAGGIPTIVGIGVRSVLYRPMLRMDGSAGIECNGRLRFASLIRLGHGSYSDEGVYIHACLAGVEIGPNTLVMHGAVLHADQLWMAPYALAAAARLPGSYQRPRLVLDQHNAVHLIPARLAAGAANPIMRYGWRGEARQMARYEH